MTPETALSLYRTTALIRRCEERIRADYSSDEMKTPVHLHIGAEGISAGVLEALPEETRLFGTYRNHGLYLGRTGDVDGFFAELYGRETGCAGGKAGSMHLTCPEKGLVLTSAVVATTLPAAAGAAFAHAYRGEKQTVAVFFGDGAVEEGAFWETLNFACLHKLNLLFVCEDNELAIHTPVLNRQGFRSIPEAAAAFRCVQEKADGWDPGEVYEKTRVLLEKMESSGMPGFLYTRYFRFLAHVGIEEDFAAGYRACPSAEDCRRMDPMEQAARLAEKNGLGEKLAAIEKEIASNIQNAVEKARRAPFPGRDDLYRGVFAG